MTMLDDSPGGSTLLKRRASLLGFASGILPASLSHKTQAWLASFLDLAFDQDDYDYPTRERMLAPLRDSGFFAPIAALEALEAFIQTTSAVSPSSSTSTMQTVTVRATSPSSPPSPCQPLSATSDADVVGAVGAAAHRRAGSDGTGTVPALRSNAVDSNASIRNGDSRAATTSLSPTFDSMGLSPGISQSLSMPAIASSESLYFRPEGSLRQKTLSRDSIRTSQLLPGRNAPSMFIHRRPLSIMTPTTSRNLFTPVGSRSNSPRPGSTPPTVSSAPTERDTDRDTRELTMPGAYVSSNASVKTGSDDTPLVTPSSAHHPLHDTIVPSSASEDDPGVGSEGLPSSTETPKPAATETLDRATSLDSPSKARPFRRSPIPTFRAPSPSPAGSHPTYILQKRANGSAPVLLLSLPSRSNSPSLAQPKTPTSPTSPVSPSSSDSPPSAFARAVSPPLPARSPYRTRPRGGSVGAVVEVEEMKSEGTQGTGREFLEQHHGRSATAGAGPSETRLEPALPKERTKGRPVEYLQQKREKELKRQAVGLGISYSAPPGNTRQPSSSGSVNAPAAVELAPRKTSLGTLASGAKDRLGRGLRKFFTAPNAEPRPSSEFVVERGRRNSEVSRQAQSAARAMRSATVGAKAGSTTTVGMRSSDDLVMIEHGSFGLGFDEDVLTRRSDASRRTGENGGSVRVVTSQ